MPLQAMEDEKEEEVWKGLPYRFQKEHEPADTWILDFWSPELRQ